MMKKKGMVLTLCATLMLGAVSVEPVSAANEISRLVPFQGRLHGSDSKVVTDGVYDLTFNVYETPTGGTPVWTESHTKVSVIHGYVNVLLGAITPMHDVNYPNVTATPAYDPSKNNVDFTKKKYLGISIDGGVEMFPRSQLVPSFHAYTSNHADHATTSDHALQADNSDKLGNLAANTYAQKTYVGDQISTVNGSVSGVSSRVSTLEGRFTGVKAKDSDKLDGLNGTDYMRTASANGYWGMLSGSSNSNWVRTTTNGLLPFQSGGASSLGTSSWNFTNIYGVNIYDGNTLLENKYLGKTAKAADANKLDGLDNTFFRNASNLNAGTISTARLPAATTTVRGATKKNQMSNATNGYFWDKETGFLIQWGKSSSTQDSAVNVSFPISFTTAHSVNISMEVVGATSNFNGFYVEGIYPAYFKANKNDNLSGTQYFYWQAVGYRAP